MIKNAHTVNIPKLLRIASSESSTPVFLAGKNSDNSIEIDSRLTSVINSKAELVKSTKEMLGKMYESMMMGYSEADVHAEIFAENKIIPDAVMNGEHLYFAIKCNEGFQGCRVKVNLKMIAESVD